MLQIPRNSNTPLSDGKTLQEYVSVQSFLERYGLSDEAIKVSGVQDIESDTPYEVL